MNLAPLHPGVLRLLRRRGRLPEPEGSASDPVAEQLPRLAGYASASIQGMIATGPRAGHPVRRLRAAARHTTDPAHMPKAHQRHLEWTPVRIIGWAQTIDPQTAVLVEAILADRPHPGPGCLPRLGGPSSAPASRARP